jgi:hypothetical protein
METPLLENSFNSAIYVLLPLRLHVMVVVTRLDKSSNAAFVYYKAFLISCILFLEIVFTTHIQHL